MEKIQKHKFGLILPGRAIVFRKKIVINLWSKAKKLVN